MNCFIKSTPKSSKADFSSTPLMAGSHWIEECYSRQTTVSGLTTTNQPILGLRFHTPYRPKYTKNSFIKITTS